MQEGKENTIPIKQDYLDNYGCLMAPIIPLKIYLTERTIKRNPERVRTEQSSIEPMKMENR